MDVRLVNLVWTGCPGHNIACYRGRLFGVREEDLTALSEQELARRPSATELAALRQTRAFRASRIGRWQQRLLRLVRPSAS